LRKQARREPEARAAADVLERLRAHLNREKPARSLDVSDEEARILQPFRFLTDKSVLYVANIDETDLPDGADQQVDAVAGFADAEGCAAISVCAKLEDELAGMDPEEAQPFLDDLGLKEPGLHRLVRATCKLLRLISFFTFNENETRAWRIPQGTSARGAAGVIHTDFEKNFIAAEVTAFADFDACGGEKGAKEKGLMRVEGRDYVVQDADVIYFKVGP
jgi:ribosome-binding ATPase YchF (GTP1/OBG family)